MIPQGIFGREIEVELFSIIESEDVQYQRDQIHQLITSMPIVNQHLLVLLLGTFRLVMMFFNFFLAIKLIQMLLYTLYNLF